MIHAPRTGTQVEITDLRTDTYFAPMVWSIKRYGTTPVASAPAAAANKDKDAGTKAGDKTARDKAAVEGKRRR